jgi:predicted amidohydrolase
MRIALIQMAVTDDKARNIRTAVERIRKQASAGAQMAVLPEMFCSPYDTSRFARYGEPPGGEAQTALSSLAAELGIYIVAGSLPELLDGLIYNTSFVYDGQGRQVARHRKVHLFDINVDGGQYFRESDVLSAGDTVTAFDTPWGRVALGICFDIRFAELASLMAREGADVFIYPGAFNMTTGPAHWELHFRARAVDNQVYTVGVAPARVERASYVSYGHSIVCDPWGRVLHDSGPGDVDAIVELDMSLVSSVRRQLPIRGARVDLGITCAEGS